MALVWRIQVAAGRVAGAWIRQAECLARMLSQEVAFEERFA